VIDTNPASPTFNTEIALIPLSGTGASGIAITPDGTRAYVSNLTSNNVSVIDTNPASPTFNTEIDLIAVSGINPAGIAITRRQIRPVPSGTPIPGFFM
jgi:YVTN family beta-propeller protein